MLEIAESHFNEVFAAAAEVDIVSFECLFVNVFVVKSPVVTSYIYVSYSVVSPCPTTILLLIPAEYGK
jgi:acyl CoA:acetate/3-ketoacid CoA transferase alpha subunit